MSLLTLPHLYFMLSSLIGQTPAHQERIAVLSTQFDAAAIGQVPADLFDDAVLAAVQDSGYFNVIGKDDLTAVLGFEQQKDLLGCDDVSCFAEIFGALNAAKLVTVKVAKLGGEWAVSAKLINIRGAPVVEARKTHFISGDKTTLIRSVPDFIVPLFSQAKNEIPLHLSIDVNDPKAYRNFMNYISESDWKNYKSAVQKGKTVPLVDWLYEKNKESNLLFVAEIAACLGVPGSLFGLPNDLGQNFSLVLLSLAGCIGFPIIDAFDFGSVQQYSPPPTAATMPPRALSPPKK